MTVGYAGVGAATARQRLQQVADELGLRYPQVAALLRDAEDDVLAYMAFPAEHWRRIHSTNVLERLNRELARRCDVVGIFPNVAAASRLLGAVLEEQHDEWIASRPGSAFPWRHHRAWATMAWEVRPAMRCPLCEVPMREVERRGVLIDVCPECRGVWLDRGELEKLLAGAERWEEEDFRHRGDPHYESDYRRHPYGRKRRKHFLDDLFDFDLPFFGDD